MLGRDEFTPNTAPIAIRVPDVAEARKRLEAAGVEFPIETIDSGVCHIAPFRDPDGNALQLHRRYAPFADGTLP
jgi:predicted enzyme related to lactoylglutathione lyase